MATDRRRGLDRNHELHCESENVLYKGDCSTWTVEKITIKGATAATAN